ncbi:hypothetical protein H1S01_17255 [Heliobacterium chlorum]|uniref:Uncharacterized protein n=1 Tax=Heliobacterium chlorum TaxID=2698 RepID=A0ABR7T612_HELCL|nr:hypothetical protein [Heliobacterium chlorum]MBC9786213.1 hypothetical protein [Heliobacterium chlorum]
MEVRRYYSVRTGKHPGLAKIDLILLRRLFNAIYSQFNEKDYFQESFGYVCVDDGDVPGTLGADIEMYFFRVLRKPDLWPITENHINYTEDDLFDVIELLYDLISKPVSGRYHSYGDCGWHYDKFDKTTGQREYRTQINDILRDYQEGYEISENGEILSLGDTGLQHLLKAEIPVFDKDNVDNRLEQAILKFRRHRSSIQDRKDAVRDLADILEFLRSKMKGLLLSNDESDLFNIANNFAIRHHNSKQKNEYDKTIWLSWIFYVYLSTIHVVVRLLIKNNIKV